MKNNGLAIIRDLWTTLLLYYLLSFVSHPSASAASECEGGQDVFAIVRENSPMGEFIANITIIGDPSANHINLSLSGADAEWFFLEGKTLKLNSSVTRILDREVHGSVLMATVACYEDGAIQNEHRVTVEILNRNDNKPEFLQDTIQPIEISELTAVNSTTFTIQAKDADGDTLIYGFDETSPDASYFRMDLPNSGRVILNRSLDYETKTQLHLDLYVVEMNTKEHYNTTATITINVADGDDQYPQFEPCTLLSISQGSPICTNPLYTVNITEKDEDIVLDFSPGPIHAVDGDRGLRTPLTYTILSGADNGRFVIDNESGEVRLTRRVENRLLTPTLRLRIMAAQRDDALKYSVATALVRVLAENRFPPQFSRTAYQGFVSETHSPASLVITYGNELLILEVTDRDFTDGFNPKLQYSLNPDSNSSHLYYITQEGLLIAKANQLQPNHKHTLEVLATDQESGDIVKAVIDIEILQKGVPVPQGPLEEGAPPNSRTVGRTGGVVGLCLILFTITLFVLIYFMKRKKQRQDPANRASVAEGKHPNVSLRWFQLVNHSRPQPLTEEVSYYNEAFSGYDSSTSTLHGKQGVYTKTDQDLGKKSQPKVNQPSDEEATPTIEDICPASKTNGKPLEKSISKSVSFQDFVVVRECDSQAEEDRDRSDSAGLEDINIDLVGLSANLDEDYTDAEEPESINAESNGAHTDSARAKTDFLNKDLDESSKELDIENSIENPRFGQLVISDLEKDKDAPDRTGQNTGDLNLTKPLDEQMVIIQEYLTQTRTGISEGAPTGNTMFDNTSGKNAFKAETFSAKMSDNIRSNTTNPDVSKKEAEITDVKCSNTGEPETSTSTSEAPNKTVLPLRTEGDNSQVEKAGEEGKVDIKIIVTIPDTDDINTDSGNEETEDMPERDMLQIRGATPDSPQHHGTKHIAQAEKTKSINKDPEEAKSGTSSMQYDSENISTNLDESNPPALFNPDINKQAMNHSEQEHLAANNSDTNIQT